MTDYPYALIIPVYRNAGSIPELLDEVAGIAATLDGPLEVTFVVDGSPDASYALLAQLLPAWPIAARLISLSRNFGSFAAIRAGLAHAEARHFAVMAADLQDPPELIAEFFRTLASEPVDVTIGSRTAREDPLPSRLFSAAYWAIYRRLILKDMPPGGADIFGCNRNVRDALVRLPEINTSLVGLLFWVGFRRKFLTYGRRERRHGTSGWSFRKKFRYMLDSIYAFTDFPISLLTVIGVAGILASIAISTVVLGAWSLGLITVPGYAPIVLSISFFGALNLFGLGVVGAYVWRTYENAKGRPHSIVLSEERFPP